MLTAAQLKDATSNANAIVNGNSIDGDDLEDHAHEAWQYAGLLNGDLIIAEEGDVENAPAVRPGRPIELRRAPSSHRNERGPRRMKR